jgi:AP-4 complex subunit mu-1
VSPSATIELLNRMAKVFKDYCGVLTEESIRKNFILIYELLDEMLDFGYPQITSTEMLKNCVHNEPIVVAKPSMAASVMGTMSTTTKASTAANVPIAMMNTRGGANKNEIYVDIVERLTILFSNTGYVVNSSIDGSILMKSYLSGNPELRLALNEDLVIGKGNGSYGSVVLDDCNFHECVHLDEFETSRTLHFLPPDGEFAVLNYRITADYRAPFKLYPTIEESGTYKVDAIVVLRADIPEANYGSNVVIRLPVPRATVSVLAEFSVEMPGCHAEYNASEKKVIYTIRKFNGSSEISLRARITLDQPVTAAHKKEIGPMSMSFEIPMYNVSNLQVRYLRISETHKSYNPCRWVRYITQSSSYVCRM